MDAQAPTFGRYRLVELIGTGGMAEVFLAKLEGIAGFERRLAIKRILPHFSKNESFVQMFIDEARLVGHFSHPNIVQIYDFGKIDDCYYISMEYVEGINVADILTRYKIEGKRVPLEVILEVSIQVCRGIDYAHKETDEQGRPLGIIHRDLTPHNLLVSRKGVVKITDFGIAKASMNTHMTQAGMIKGKVPYMSPEQATGMPLTHVSDIFAFGIVMYEMCTLRRLFEGENDFTILRKVQEANIPSIRDQNPEVPDELERIIRKALSRDRADRYQWASEMEMELTRLKFGLGPKYQHFSLAEFVAGFMNRVPMRHAPPPPPPPTPVAPEEDVEQSLSAIAADLSSLSNPLELARAGGNQAGADVAPEDRPTQLLVTDADGNPVLPDDVKQLLQRSALSNLVPSRSASPSAPVAPPSSSPAEPVPSRGLVGGTNNLAPTTGAASQSGSSAAVTPPAVPSRASGPVHLEAAAAPVQPVGASAMALPTTPSAPVAHSATHGSTRRDVLPVSSSNRRGLLIALVAGAALLSALLVWLLRPTTGSLEVQYTPGDAEVLLNGQQVASQSPFIQEGLPDGDTVTITVRREGYREVTRQLTIEAGKRFVFPIKLQAAPAPPAPEVAPASSPVNTPNPAGEQRTDTPATPSGAIQGEVQVPPTTTATTAGETAR